MKTRRVNFWPDRSIDQYTVLFQFEPELDLFTLKPMEFYRIIYSIMFEGVYNNSLNILESEKLYQCIWKNKYKYKILIYQLKIYQLYRN